MSDATSSSCGTTGRRFVSRCTPNRHAILALFRLSSRSPFAVSLTAIDMLPRPSCSSGADPRAVRGHRPPRGPRGISKLPFVDSFRNAADSLAASERRLVAQSDALTELATRYTIPGEQFAGRLRSILEIAARALDVERLSMWEFDAQHTLIRCAGLHLRSGNRHESGAVLGRDIAPAYFDAIERERVVAAGDAQRDPRTCEFRDGYLVPNRIGAMLDVPL